MLEESFLDLAFSKYQHLNHILNYLDSIENNTNGETNIYQNSMGNKYQGPAQAHFGNLGIWEPGNLGLEKTSNSNSQNQNLSRPKCRQGHD